MEQLPKIIEQSMSNIAYSCLIDMLFIGCVSMFLVVLGIATQTK